MNWYKLAQQGYLWDNDPSLSHANTSWEPSGDIFEDIKECSTMGELNRIFNAYNLNYNRNLEEIKFANGEVVLIIDINKDSKLIELNFPYPDIYDPKEWIYNLSDSQLYEFLEWKDFNDKFWEEVSSGEILYHGTNLEYFDIIKKEGLLPMNRTRGIENRYTPAGIFASENIDLASTYGDIIGINVGEMKNDNYMPVVSIEEPVEEAQMREAIAHKLGVDNFISEYEAGIEPDTVIFYGKIPPKYLIFK